MDHEQYLIVLGMCSVSACFGWALGTKNGRLATACEVALGLLVTGLFIS